MRTKRLLFSLLALAVAGCGAIGGQTPTALPTVVLGGGTPSATSQAPAPGGTVTASGHIEPAAQTQLVFATTGKVISLTVAANDTVQAGQVVAMLSGADSLAAAVQTANLNVLNAQQALSDLQDNAALAASQAQVAVAQAQTALTKANTDVRNAQNPAGQSLYDAVHDAQLALQTAQANAQLATVSQPVQDYTSQYWLTDYYWKRYQDLEAKYNAAPNPDSLTKAQNAYNDWKVLADQQSQRQLTFQTDQANKNDAVGKAQKAYNDAVNNLNGALKGPDANKLALAQANAQLAQNTLAQAEAHYAAVKAGPDPERLAADQQTLVTAQAQLAAAQSALDDLVLRATISGTVTELSVHVGEWVIPGQAVMVLTDLAHLRVETTDLSERDVPQVSVGQPVSVLVKPLNQSLPGHVTEIAPLADTLGGDVVYKTTIELGTRPAALRAGMSVDVTFGVSP
jgi:multidrug efflux pump subunit AcrA (membrane-fusion protein)